jgi:hypothetical protein
MKLKKAAAGVGAVNRFQKPRPLSPLRQADKCFRSNWCFCMVEGLKKNRFWNERSVS